MEKNFTAMTVIQLEASTSAAFARGDDYGDRAGETIYKKIAKKTGIYGIMIAVLASTLLTGCYMHPPSGVGIYVPPVGVSIYTPPPHYGGPHHRPHHWRRHRPRHWH